MISAFGLEFQNPIVLAAGTAGFGRELDGLIQFSRLGAISTKAVSLAPRIGNAAPRVAEWSGGMINAVGLANPGLERVIEEELPWLREHAAPARIITNVVGFELEEYPSVVSAIEETGMTDAFELNVSCPNTDRGGEEFGADPGVLSQLITRCRGETDRPLIAKLSPVVPDLMKTVQAAVDAGADGFTLFNTIPGLVLRDGNTRVARGQGGISGPALLPVSVLAVKRIVEATGLPVIGLGGVTCEDDMSQYLAAGASLVGVGTAALADPRVPERLASAWSRS